jgi:hypothetical protein
MGGILLSAAPLEAQSTPGEPCYLRLTAIGRTTALCDSGPPVTEELVSLHLPVSGAEPVPSIHLLRYDFTEEMVYFDRECNRRRYARTDFTCGNGSIWYQDSRDQWVEISKVCTGGACQKEGGPCRTGGDCCKGYRCHAKLKTCQGLARTDPEPPSPASARQP